MRTSRVMFETLTVLALLGSIMVSLAVTRRHRDIEEASLRLIPGSARAGVQDRLIGTHVDVARLAGRSAPTSNNAADTYLPGRSALLWVVDLERCFGCLDGVGAWSRLEASSKVPMMLYLVGEITPPVRARLRNLRRTQVHVTDAASVLSTLGRILPSTKVLVSAEGFALMVDSRAAGQDCGWSFDAQVGALMGLNSATEMRAASAP